MYAELKMELDNETLDYKQSSNLQGVIMEHIEEEYAEILHQSNLKPYSQCVVKQDDKRIWYIRTVTQEAYKKMIIPLSQLNEFEIKNGQIHVNIVRRNFETRAENELLKEFYEIPANRFLNLTFQTPTAFKSNGKYVFYPDIRMIYQSLMMKYTASSEEMDMIDEDTLEQLTQNSEIVRYHLRSMSFPLEGVNIPGFVGSIRLKIKGTGTMARYARMLMKYGQYSGVGIKTAMGMGAIRLMEQGEKKNDR
ncbi:CRISPR-associated endoribonuclease Cas6 [Jingyaoa shaoxingensis]|uniref:CRISPR-associated endoribonuclease Cas6 n=1 Tax=Jingyaoa shaoxingensis TaxID=2763671 RepID=A0ABR7N656_9FIRM|nr:CRISPR-associated endoribonuclease Cas6 [Jingyaoa shaoxingensis]MBC8571880.1 CRISPR-associated endoribonuclease Cas6 [Jingyaoa shaoxingensis]